MSSLTFTPREFDAFKACWAVGSQGLPDDRWASVEKSLAEAPGDLDGVDVELDGEAFDDALFAFGVGWEGFVPGDRKEREVLADMDSAAEVLGLGRAPAP